MKRILHVLGTLNCGGAESMVMNYYRSIDRRNFQFDFVIHTREKGDYTEEILQMGGRIYHVPQYKGINHFEYVRKWKEFFSQHPEYKVLHSHVRSTASIYLPIAKRHGLKTIIHSHSTSNGSGLVALIKKMFQYPLRYQADYFLSCSQEAGEWLYGNKVCSGKRYRVISNAIDIKKYERNELVRLDYRKRMKVKDKYVFIHVGRLHEAKNHSFLLKLYKEITKIQANTVLWLVGDGDLWQEIEMLIHKLELQDNVKMLGSRDDVPQLMQAADMFLFPSKWEGVPLAIIEAQYAGLKCVVSDSITREIEITNFVKRCSLESDLSVWLTEIFKHSENDDVIVKKSISSNFSIDNSCEKLVEIYNNLME